MAHVMYINASVPKEGHCVNNVYLNEIFQYFNLVSQKQPKRLGKRLLKNTCVHASQHVSSDSYGARCSRVSADHPSINILRCEVYCYMFLITLSAVTRILRGDNISCRLQQAGEDLRRMEDEYLRLHQQVKTGARDESSVGNSRLDTVLDENNNRHSRANRRKNGSEGDDAKHPGGTDGVSTMGFITEHEAHGRDRGIKWCTMNDADGGIASNTGKNFSEIGRCEAFSCTYPRS